VIAELEVRRPDLRPLRRWLDDRDVALSVLIAMPHESPEGVLLIPNSLVRSPLDLEQSHALIDACAALASACHHFCAHQRHLERERQLSQQLSERDECITHLHHEASLRGEYTRLATLRLAQSAEAGMYSAPFKFALVALDRRMASDTSAVLVVPPGFDPVPLIARAHLQGPRAHRPVAVVDAAAAYEHGEGAFDRWRDRSVSPLALADGGLLVLVDGAALDATTQKLIADCLAHKRRPWEQAEPLDVRIVLTATRDPRYLVQLEMLTPELFARVSEAPPIVIPGLKDRPEDLFSIVTEQLAREGLRMHGAPMGIEPAAFAKLVEHPFEGEQRELAAIVTRLVRNAQGPVIRARDVDNLGLVAARSSDPGEAT
jgi:hypothetical protein